MKSINIITPDNGVGLSQDRAILRELLERNGHEVHYRTDKIPSKRNEHFDVNIFCEVVYPEWFRQARKNILIPNPEWFYKEWTKNLSTFDAVLCKTEHTYRLFSSLTSRAHYTSFTSTDRHLPEVERTNTFAHFAGKSSHKGTNELIAATQHLSLPKVTIYSHNPNKRFIDYSMVDRNKITIYTERMNDEAMRIAQNQHRFHVCTSNYEGFGHYINEARSVGAIIITTNAEPMNQLVTSRFGYGVASARSAAKHNMVYLNTPSVPSIADAIQSASELTDDIVQQLSAASREAYLKGKAEFEELFLNRIEELTT
jgi:hypothetical protein